MSAPPVHAARRRRREGSRPSGAWMIGHARTGSSPRTLVWSASTRASIAALALIAALFASGRLSAHAQTNGLEPAIAEAGDPMLVRLEELSSALRSEDETERRRAYDSLTTLDADMLPAIRARIARLRRQRPERDAALEAFNRVRRAAGSERADDDTDMAPGALVVLGQERTDRVIAIVEPLLLWRSLERLGTFESCQAMYPLIGIDGDVWKWEARRVVRRMGTKILAAAIAGRGSDDRTVRGWASATVHSLGADEPGLAVQGLEPDRLADVLRAFAMTRVQSAMRVIVSYVDSDRRSVRRAARWAMDQYGTNAIWILRTEYRNQTGEPAPEQWGWQRVRDALYAHVDAAHMEPVRRARDAGLAARERGDLREMQARFDEVLAQAPDLEDAGPIAEGYAALADAQLDARRLDEAARAYRRALRLAPDHADAQRWRARLTFAEAERALAAGVLDEHAYRRVVELDPEHAGARRVLTALEPTAPIAGTNGRARWLLAGAALFALLGAGLLRRRSERVIDEPVETSTDEPFDPVDATLADSTLPG